MCTWYGKRNASLFSFKIKMEIHKFNKWYVNRTTKQCFRTNWISFVKRLASFFRLYWFIKAEYIINFHIYVYQHHWIGTSFTRCYFWFNSSNVCRYQIYPTLFDDIPLERTCGDKFHYDSSILNILWLWQKLNVFFQSISNLNRYVHNWTEVYAMCEIPFAYLADYFVTTNKPKYNTQSDHLLGSCFSIGQWIFTPFLGPIITVIVVHNV